MTEERPAYVLKPILPLTVIQIINSFVPLPKKKKGHVSPTLQKDLQKIQSMELKGKNGMYMKGLDDFILE